MVIGTSRAVGLPIWVLSLDLSEAFDRIDTKALWAALCDHGISPHMIWIIQRLYSEQVGQVTTPTELWKEFPIRAGVRRGCVLSPRLFCVVLEWAMHDWKQAGHHFGIPLQRNVRALTDLHGPACDSGSARDAGEKLAGCKSQVRTSLSRTATRCQPQSGSAGSSPRPRAGGASAPPLTVAQVGAWYMSRHGRRCAWANDAVALAASSLLEEQRRRAAAARRGKHRDPWRSGGNDQSPTQTSASGSEPRGAMPGGWFFPSCIALMQADAGVLPECTRGASYSGRGHSGGAILAR